MFAGLDLDCGHFLGVHTEQALGRGLIHEVDVNNALTNTIAVQMRLGMFDGERLGGEFGNLGSRDVCNPTHQQLALEAARQGIVLLKNRGSLLPLSIRSHRTVAVIGPNSNATVTMIGNYAGVACAYTSPLQGIRRYARAIHQEGCIGVACEGVQGFGKVEAAARVAKASRGPTVLVLISGGPIDVSFAKNDPQISAILWVGYPGQPGGAAIADILFGTNNPGGKLPMTWYPQGYVERVPMTIMDMRANPFTGYPGLTVPYAGPHALKNSSVMSNGLKIEHANCDELIIPVYIDVKNTGTLDGILSLLLFSFPPPGIWATNKQLIGFEKVHVAV
ncbi:putative beta-D-xylosidase [Carya illinoinensis]|uniref:putative beta-D-xylosidase n=1 Tax=Carya illinoinensis TaxID=32201 RepID=UPI001C7225DE|nr:putative beta-D-xylosidase [Carya illinoinensis]